MLSKIHFNKYYLFCLLCVLSCTDFNCKDKIDLRKTEIISFSKGDKKFVLNANSNTFLNGIPIGVYDLNSEFVNYNGEKDFSQFVDICENRKNIFVYILNQPVAYVKLELIDNKWILLDDIYSIESVNNDSITQDRGYYLFEMANWLKLNKNKDVYTVRFLGGFWYNQNDKTQVFNFFNVPMEFCAADIYIKNSFVESDFKYIVNSDTLNIDKLNCSNSKGYQYLMIPKIERLVNKNANPSNELVE